MYTIGLVVNKINSKMHNIEDIKAEEQRRITSREIEKIISKNRVKKIIADNKIIENLLKSKVNFVFNLSTGSKAKADNLKYLPYWKC